MYTFNGINIKKINTKEIESQKLYFLVYKKFISCISWFLTLGVKYNYKIYEYKYGSIVFLVFLLLVFLEKLRRDK